MSELSYFISPIAGAAIGYFTNWLAIKMLFRPHTKKSCMGVKLPFTPGLIPKEKEKLAKSLGDAIGENILTEKALIEAIQKPEIMESLEKMYDESKKRIFKSQDTVEILAEKILHKEHEQLRNTARQGFYDLMESVMYKPQIKELVSNFICERVEDILNQPLSILPIESLKQWSNSSITSGAEWLSENEALRNILRDRLLTFYSELEKDDRKLFEIMTPQSLESLKNIVSAKAPDGIRLILELAETPEVSEAMTPLIKMAVTKMAGRWAAFFINGDKVYKKLLEGGKEYLEDETHREEMSRFAVLTVEKCLERRISETAAIGHGFYEVNLDKLLNYILKQESLEGMMNRLSGDIWCSFDSKKDMKIKDVLRWKEEEIKQTVREWTEKNIDYLLSHSIQYLEKHFIQWENNIWNTKICDISIPLEKWLDYLKPGVLQVGGFLLIKAAPYGIQALDIPAIVEQQINEFDMKRIEELSLEIAKKELNAITMIGGVLGFIIGCVPVVLGIMGI